jgi:anti-sigma regulatory factor (Ser/Thr protein kinase)
MESQGLSKESIRSVDLGLEETITNILKYGYDDEAEHEIEIAIDATQTELRIAVVDDGHEFNPLAHPPPRINAPLEDRQPGGLGIAFLREFFDDAQYRREAGKNRLVLCKRLR